MAFVAELEAFASERLAPILGAVVGTILVVIAVALIWPQIRKYGRLDSGR